MVYAKLFPASFLILLFCQTAAQLVSVGMIIHGHTLHPTSASSLLFRPWFVVLVLAGAVERLSGLALGVAVERDWVVLVLLFELCFVNYILLFDYLTVLEQFPNFKSCFYS